MKEKSIEIIGNTKKSAVRVAEDAIVRYPWLVNPLLQGAATVLSPFDHHLRLQILRWETRLCELKIPSLRRLRDHQKKIHSSVVTAAGERAAFFLLHRNFPFWRYVLELKEVQTVFEKTEGKSLLARCELDADSLAVLENTIKEKRETHARLKTDIFVLDSETLVAHVRTNWIVTKRKWPWEQWNF